MYEIEISSDLLTWNAGSSVHIENMQNGGVLSETHRIAAIPGQPRFFVRLRASARLIQMNFKFLAIALLLAVRVSPGADVEVIAHWRFEPGNFLQDSSPSGAHPLFNPGGTNAPVSSTDVAGAPGGAGSARFDGSDYFRTSTRLDLSSYRRLRISWMQRLQTTGLAVTFEHSSNYNSNPGAFLHVNHSDIPSGASVQGYIGLRSDGYNNDGHPEASGAAPGVWETFVAEINLDAGSQSEVVRIFDGNGNEIGFDYPNNQGSAPGAFLNDFFYIGARAAPSVGFVGNIDELKIERLPEIPIPPVPPVAVGGPRAPASGVDSTTVFNEVMYHPRGEGDAEWIELHNLMAVNMDLSGWRIAGGVNFTFPNGTTIPAGGYRVVASNPAALQASAGISGVLGPWTGALDNGSETIWLETHIGRTMDEFAYGDSGRFPVAADGGGVSLAKRAPRLASGEPENWAGSAQVGGTPGAENFPGGQPVASPQIVINEFGGSSDASWRIELRNNGATSLELGGLVLAASNAPGGYTLPAGSLAPGALLVLEEAQLGFRPLLNDRVFLYHPPRTVLLDAAVVKATTRARLGAEFLVPSAATFGAENTFALQSDVVINEVMYHFPPNPSVPGVLPVTENPEEWIELHNRGTAAVNVAGWSFDGAIAFTFPGGASIPAEGYLVVAKDADALTAKWPEAGARIIGNFAGNLANRGERIALKDASGNPADAVRYFTGGAWPSVPDGKGVSLELRDARADNANGAAWAASDESGDTAWQTVTYRMVAGQTFGLTQWNEFRIGMLDEGECLIDDVSVVRDPDGARQQLIQGGDFTTLTSKWRLLGHHGTSAIEPEPGNLSNPVLHVRATGQFDTHYNHIESTFVGNTAVVNGQVYEVSFRARWLSGSNQLNTRAYSARLARTTELAMPARIGTPGAPNSRAATNIGPTMSALAHTPVLPAANAPVTVSVRATDPDGVGPLTLRYALNGSATFSAVAMSAQPGGLFTATVPGQSAGTIVQLYVEAQDALGASAQLPAGGPTSRALYIVNDGQGSALSAHEMRIIMLPAESARMLQTLNRMSDARIGGTAIYRRAEVFYDAGVRLQGSTFGRVYAGEGSVGYDIGFPADHLFRGVHDSVNIDRSGHTPASRGQDEIYVKHMFNRAGVPCSFDDLCYLIAPSSAHTGTAILQMAALEKTFVDSQFHENGSVFHLDAPHDPATTTDRNPESPKNPAPIGGPITTDLTNLGPDKEQYRSPLEIRVGRRRDDFSGIIKFCQTMSLSGTRLAAEIGTWMDVDEWMRCTALYSLTGIGDTYMTGGSKHNLRIYIPPEGRRAVALPWDMDFVFNHAPTSPAILAGYNLRRVIDIPANTRLYYGHLHDLCNTVFRSDYMGPWMAHYGSVVGQNMGAQSGYIDQRRASVLGQLPAQVPFAITTNGGAPFSVNASTATLEGNGWVNIREFRRADTGAVLPAEWTELTKWRVSVALNYGENPITIQAFDFSGALIASASTVITSTLEVPAPRNFLRVSELHYHPAAPSGAELNASTDKNDFEFIELRNIGAQPLDISGCAFTAGIDFTFPANTTLVPNEAILVVRHTAAFEARYGAAARVAGAYGPADSLSNSGELVALKDATGAEIASFTFRDILPWPTTPDGAGPSLVAIAPHLPLNRDDPANWRASSANGGNPGSSDSVSFAGSPTADADQDGVSAFLEHALGTSDTAAESGRAAVPLARDASGVFFTFTRRLVADDVLYAVEVSSDLVSWTTAATEVVDRTQNGNVLTETHRIVSPAPSGPTLFGRLRATSR